jgi:hypothetical protein
MSAMSTGLSRARTDTPSSAHEVNPSHRGKRPRTRSPLSIAPLAVSPRTAGHLLGLGQSRIYNLMRSGELQNYVDGGARRIVMASITEYFARRVAASAGGWKQRPHNPRALAAPSRRGKRTSEARAENTA